MRICPHCRERFTDESRFCANDGTALSVDADSLVGTTLSGEYELVAVCGRGSMGTVYLARQAGMGRDVAVEVLRRELVADPGVVRRFHREARSVAQVEHPNVVGVYSVGETADGLPYIVLEHLAGRSLADVLEAEGRLEVDRALAIAAQVADGLGAAHAAGIVHRDLKPANLLLCAGRAGAEQVKVLDFGIAKLLRPELLSGKSFADQLTRTGMVFGTPHYMAPEQASGGEVDARADLYSLGVILFRALTGRLPFEGTGISVLLAHVQQPAPRARSFAPSLDAALDELLDRALAKDPAQRLQTAGDLLLAIARLRQGEGAASYRGTTEAGPMTPSGGSTVEHSPLTSSLGLAPAPRKVPSVAWILVAAALVGVTSIVLWRGGRSLTVPQSTLPAVAATAGEQPAAPMSSPPDPPISARVVTLGERGYSVRAVVPARILVQEDVELRIEVQDPAGRPLTAPTLAVTVEEPGGVERAWVLGPGEAPGRYRGRRRFAATGLHHVHVFPAAGDKKLRVWFDVRVEGPLSFDAAPAPRAVAGSGAMTWPSFVRAAPRADAGAAPPAPDAAPMPRPPDAEDYRIMEDEQPDETTPLARPDADSELL